MAAGAEFSSASLAEVAPYLQHCDLEGHELLLKPDSADVELPGVGPRIHDLLRPVARQIVDLGAGENGGETKGRRGGAGGSGGGAADSAKVARVLSQLRGIVNTAVLRAPDKCNPSRAGDADYCAQFALYVAFWTKYTGTLVCVCDYFDQKMLRYLIEANGPAFLADLGRLGVGAAATAEAAFKRLCTAAAGVAPADADRMYAAAVARADFIGGKVSALPSETGLGFLVRDAGGAKEETQGIIQFECITNDGLPEKLYKLTMLKNIFSRQLPKMPKEYITRLVFDFNHYSFCLLKRDQVIGGVCFRPFFSQQFAEIAFLAVTSTEQVKGYGTRLMSHLKEHAKAAGVKHFLTYADNFAIGYFRKQGFSDRIDLPTAQWAGYIKDYDGGTLMECKLHDGINYLKLPDILQAQRERVLQLLEQKRPPQQVYPGLDWWQRWGSSFRAKPSEIPGFLETGWKPYMALPRAQIRGGDENSGFLHAAAVGAGGKLGYQLMTVLDALLKHENSWPFRKPVSSAEAVDYYKFIKRPMDISSMRRKLKKGQYVSKAEFKSDLILMFDNCRLYNHPSTIYYKYANELQNFILPKLDAAVSDAQT